MTPDEKVAYEAGWRASRVTTDCDLGAAEARFIARHGYDFGGTAFAAGWVDMACGYDKWTAFADDAPEPVVGDEVVIAYPEGDADTGWVVDVAATAITVEVGDRLVVTIPEAVAVLTDPRRNRVASIPSPDTQPEEAPSMALDNDHATIPDDEVWNADTGETFGEARARFATFGPEVPASRVPALVRAGLTVWSFGYGDDPEDFTTIEESDLDGTDWSDPADTDVWAPFRLDRLTQDGDRIVAGVEPTVAPSTDSLLRRTIVGVMEEVTGPGVLTHGEAADIIIRALVSEGFEVLSPDDLSWGECPGNDGGPHVVSLSLCAGCLEYDPD